jgi:hypothetical protein
MSFPPIQHKFKTYAGHDHPVLVLNILAGDFNVALRRVEPYCLLNLDIYLLLLLY